MFSCSKQIGINQGSMNLNNPWGQCRLPEVFVSARGPTSLLSQARACCHLHGSGPSHQEILEASGMDRHPKGMWSQLGFACHPLCTGAEPFSWSPAHSTLGGAARSFFSVPFSAQSAQKQNPACAPRPGRSPTDGVGSAQLPPGPRARPEAAGPKLSKTQRGE